MRRRAMTDVLVDFVYGDDDDDDDDHDDGDHDHDDQDDRQGDVYHFALYSSAPWKSISKPLSVICHGMNYEIEDDHIEI